MYINIISSLTAIRSHMSSRRADEHKIQDYFKAESGPPKNPLVAINQTDTKSGDGSN